MLTKKDLISAFYALGVKAGIPLLVHSSLSAFGQVDGGAHTVIDALLDVLSPEGTLVMPSFNHGDIYVAGDIFDVNTTPTINGIIPETFRKRPGVYRSLSCTHAFAAQGKNAQRYLQEHHTVSPMGKDSPVDHMFADDGWVLLLGVSFCANSFHHYVEEMENAPCLALSEPYPVRTSDGTIIHVPTWKWRNAECPYNDTAGFLQNTTMYHQPLLDGGIAKTAIIGDAQVFLYNMRAAYDTIAHFMREGAEGFPPCKHCTVRPVENWF